MDNSLRDTFWHAFAASPFLMIGLEASKEHAAPMTALLDRHAHQTLWFFAGRDSRIAPGGPATAQVVSREHDVFASLSGTIVEELDSEIRERHWSNAVEAWFPDGKTDTEQVPMLRFDIEDAEVWSADMGLKGAFRLLTGKPIDTQSAGDHARGAV